MDKPKINKAGLLHIPSFSLYNIFLKSDTDRLSLTLTNGLQKADNSKIPRSMLVWYEANNIDIKNVII